MATAFVVPVPGRPVGEALREARLAAGLSQEAVAQRSGVARPNISAIEMGGRSPSPEMTKRILDAIRGRDRLMPSLHLSPAVLANIELSRSAAFRVIRDPDGSRDLMRRELASLRRADDGSASSWLDYWDDALERWSTSELVQSLLSTNPEDVELRKVSPVRAAVPADEAAAALARARMLWRATRRV